MQTEPVTQPTEGNRTLTIGPVTILVPALNWTSYEHSGTPGEILATAASWEIRVSKWEYGQFDLIRDDGDEHNDEPHGTWETFAEAQWHAEESEARIRLAGSAPELLAELRNVLRLYERDNIHENRFSKVMGHGVRVWMTFKTYEHIRTAITKAIG